MCVAPKGEIEQHTEQPRCQCPNEAAPPVEMRGMYSETEWAVATHAPGRCAGTWDLAQYQRGEQVLWLCSCCHVFGDIRL